MKIDIEKLVSHTAFFQGISESGHRLLASICIPKKILKKEILFHQEERGHSIFLLAMGSIRLSKFTPSGEEVVIKVLGLHEVFAEVILFEEELYPVTATALTESVVLQIPKREVLQLLNKESFRNDFIRLLMKKQRYLADQIHLLRSADVQTRFFHFLRDQYGDREEIPMTISKKDVAAAIGTTPETLSRLLQCLKKKRQLVWSGSAIRVSPGFWSRTPASF